MKNTAIALLVAVSALSVTAAKAAVVFTATASPAGFNENAPGYAHATGNITAPFTELGVTYTNLGSAGSSQVKTSPSDGNGAVPFNNTTPGMHYISVLGGGNLSLTFADTSAISFYWGSIDTYNNIEFFNNNVSLGTLSGSNAALQASLTANGNQGSYNSNRFVTITETGGVFDEVRFTSGSNSFEFFNVQAVPEASTWAMMILGFLGLGFFGYRKSSKAPGAAFRIA